MIRMGRRTDEPETNAYQTQAADPSNLYSADAPASTGRALSESDAMARDIKEGRLSGFVGHGTVLSGDTQFHAMLRVDGHLIGSVSSESGTLIVGNNGQVDANVSVAAAMVNGSVHGDISASEKLQLGRTARVMGNISSPRLIIEEGAILEGSCSMLRAREIEEEEPESSVEENSGPTIAAPVTDQEEDDSTAYLFDSESSDEDEEPEAEAAAGA